MKNLLAIVILLISGNTVRAEQPDPYGAGARQWDTAQRVERYKADLLAAKDLYRVVGFALGCHVLVNAAQGHVLVRNEEFSLMQQLHAIGYGQWLKPMHDSLDAARSEGLSRAREPGACDYWKQHLDEAYKLRNTPLY